MASLSSPSSLLFLLFFFLFLSLSIPTSYSQKTELASRRNLAIMEQGEDDQPVSRPPLKKKIPTFDSKNQSKPFKSKKSNSTTTSSSITQISTSKSKLNKTLTLNSTAKPSNSTNLTKTSKISTSKPSNSTKLTKLVKSNFTNSTKAQLKSFDSTFNSTKTKLKSVNSTSNSPKSDKKTLDPKKPVKPDAIWLEDNEMDGEDLISEFRDLPTRIHQAFLPDLEKISITSRAYIYRANKEIAAGVKPFVGNKYAPKIATAASCVFLILPLCLVTLLFYQLKSYLSLQHFLIFVQAYLAIYFATLSLTAVVTGLEPLRFFYATSPSSYAWTQAVQTLGYVLYLLVQLINLVVVFSAGDGGMGPKALGLAQMVVGLAVGLHYYAAVFHPAVLGNPPRANWKIHGVYAACFLVICAFARAERRKKAYAGGEDGKKS